MQYNPPCDERIGAALSVPFGRTIRGATLIGPPVTETPATRAFRVQAARQRQAGQVGFDVRFRAEFLAAHSFRFFQIAALQTARKHACMVLMALKKPSLLEPGHGDSALGIRIRRIGIDS